MVQTGKSVPSVHGHVYWRKVERVLLLDLRFVFVVRTGLTGLYFQEGFGFLEGGFGVQRRRRRGGLLLLLTHEEKE